jgi:hypothetical protein
VMAQRDERVNQGRDDALGSTIIMRRNDEL